MTGTQKPGDDQTQSRNERLANVRLLRYQADKEIREILDVGQKRLDTLEQQSHAEFHGDLN
jgi:hypothetical protein